MNREEAVAIGLTWLKGPRDKPYITVAKSLKYLRGLPEFKNNDDVGDLFGVSGEMVREFLSLLTLPEQVQRMLDNKELRIDQGTKLASLLRRKPEKFEETAKVLAGVPYQDARDIIDFIIKNPGVSASEAKRRVIEAKVRIEDEFHIVAVLGKEEFQELQKAAKSRGDSANSLVTEIVKQWLNSTLKGGADGDPL